MDRARIANRTRGTMLHESPRWALSPLRQALGLMFTVPKDDALIFPFFPSRVARLHMWFVFGPIDVLGLDGQGRVVALKERLRPWSLWSTKVPVSAVLELPAGSIAATGTRIGDHIGLPRPPLQ